MEFRCPNCDRIELIVLDRHPLCLRCRAEMIPASDYSGWWMSPYIAIRRMITTNETHGTEAARTEGRFKKEREAWTTGMFALALKKLKQQEFWIEIETAENTPDTKLHHIDQSTGRNNIETRDIEVVDWDEHVDDIMEVIRKKCARAYPRNYFLLVHARSGKRFDLDKVIEEVKTIHSPFLEIWILGRPPARNPLEPSSQMVVARIAPSPVLRLEFDIPAELEKAKGQNQFLRRRKRGTSTEFTDLGLVYLPIP